MCRPYDTAWFTAFDQPMSVRVNNALYRNGFTPYRIGPRRPSRLTRALPPGPRAPLSRSLSAAEPPGSVSFLLDAGPSMSPRHLVLKYVLFPPFRPLLRFPSLLRGGSHLPTRPVQRALTPRPVPGFTLLYPPALPQILVSFACSSLTLLNLLYILCSGSYR